jgi:hypothetical protein
MTLYTTLSALMTNILLSSAPPVRANGTPDSIENAFPRYAQFAEAMVTVAYDPSEQSPFQGPYARLEALSLVGALVLTESHMDELVISGKKRGDRGRSVCGTQMNIGRGLTLEGWSADDLIADPTKCIAAGLHAARRSMGACRSGPALHALAAYASGNCSMGHKESRAKMNTKFYIQSTLQQRAKKLGISLKDDDVMAQSTESIALAD